jgi:IclR family acetate operon transcriptional repressor
VATTSYWHQVRPLGWRESWCEAVLEQPLKPCTERTFAGPEALRRELGHVRARGYAIEDREYQPDTRALAAPVCPKEEAIAALGVVAPLDALPAERHPDVGCKLMDAADALAAVVEGWS